MKLIPILLSCALALPMMHAMAPAESVETAVPLKMGQEAPRVSVQTDEGKPYDLGAVVRGKPTVLIFYRGGWCPYCNLHLAALQEIEGELIELGYQILAVSPDKPEALQPTVDKNKLHYQLLSDRDMIAASAYGVAYRVPGNIRAKYEGFGFDLAPVPAEPEARWLPVPAVFLIDEKGVIRFVHTNPDYKVRIDPADLLEAAESVIATNE